MSRTLYSLNHNSHCSLLVLTQELPPLYASCACIWAAVVLVMLMLIFWSSGILFWNVLLPICSAWFLKHSALPLAVCCTTVLVVFYLKLFVLFSGLLFIIHYLSQLSYYCVCDQCLSHFSIHPIAFSVPSAPQLFGLRYFCYLHFNLTVPHA